MPVSGSGAVVCSWSLLFAAIIAGVRQKLHLSTCSNLRGRLSQSFSLILNSSSADLQAQVSNRSPHVMQVQRLTISHSLTNSDHSGTNSVSPHLAHFVPWSVLLMDAAF